MIINQIFRLLIGIEVPEEIVKEILWYLPEDEQVEKKKRMLKDLWFFENHTSERGCTSYWSFSEEEKDGYFTRVVNKNGEMVYCDIYRTRNSQCIFWNDFITWKHDLYSDDYSSGYRSLLFNHDGESSNKFRFLKKTDEFVLEFTPDESNMNLFLREEIGNDEVYGIDVLNIISKAIDGKYKVVIDICGFEGDDTGDYENEIISIYNELGTNQSNSEYLQSFLKKKHSEWLNNEPFSGLVIGDNPELEYGSPIETRKGEKFFSIYSKPNPEDIMGGYWGYCRDKKVVENDTTKILSGPSIAHSWWNRK